MLAKLILSLFKIDYKNHYYHPLTIASELFAIVGTLVIYWFTSKAFHLSIQNHLHQDYFSYILIGDLFLSTPLYFMDTFVRKIKLSIHDRTFHTFLSLPLSIFKIIMTLGISGLVRDLMRTSITFALAYLIFSFQLPVSNFLMALLFQLLFLLPFIALGIILSLFILYIGRGDGMLAYINTIGSFLAGAFFPISVLPLWIQKVSLYFSPITFFLEQTRSILRQGVPSMQISHFVGVFLLWNLLTIVLAAVVYRIIVSKLYSKGFQLLITY